MSTTTEVFLRLELLKNNPDLIAKLEAERRKDREEYLRSSVQRLGGTVKRYGEDCLIVSISQPRAVNLSDPGHGRRLERDPLPVKTPKAAPLPSDYPRLLIAEFRRKETWRPSSKWKANHVDLLSYISKNRRDQVALVAAEMAAEELGIERPEVRAWRGDEKPAEHKWGWVFSNEPSEINVTLDQNGRAIAETAAHECRHVWQFKSFANITVEQREKDATAYASDFIERVFEKKAA